MVKPTNKSWLRLRMFYGKEIIGRSVEVGLVAYPTTLAQLLDHETEPHLGEKSSSCCLPSSMAELRVVGIATITQI